VWGSPAEVKVFNPNIGKLYPKTVSCHLFGYTEKSKGFRFYCPERHIKFVETRHAVFVEDEKMRGSMVAREIDLEVKRVYAPTPMIHEPTFSLHVVAAPTVQDTMVSAPVVISPMAKMNENEKHVLQDPIEPIATHEGEQQPPQTVDVPNVEALRRSQRVRKSVISVDYEVYNTKEFKMEDDPTSFEEAMRSDHSSKWLEAMEDEMKLMNANRVWDLEIIPKGANTVGCKWVYRTKLDSQGNIETYKA
jgi:hypothetical protein